MEELMIKTQNVTKEYQLGAIGGTTLREELQRRRAKRKHQEDPTLKIGQTRGNVGERFLALNNVSFEVKKGEAVGIIGHNGAGKSTLLKLLTRITAPTVGDIYLNGRVASMLEVGTGFHGELTGRENVYLNGAILGMSRKEIDAKMDAIIAFSEIGQFIDTPVKRYSSGMYVKLAFSVAAHLDSEIMIMDEVLAVGDMAFQRKCLAKMRQAAKEEGRTVLYVSHNMSTIRQLCDRCIVLDHGTVIFDGDVEEAITLYLGDSANSMGVDIDLSSARMQHLPKEIAAKIRRVQLLGKEDSRYEFGEKIRTRISVSANQAVAAPCMRMEIRTAGDLSVGAGYVHTLAPIDAGEAAQYELTLDTSGLVPGEYKVCMVLYEVNEFGAYIDLDAILPAFTFEVIDSKDTLGIRWNAKHWGNVCFGKLESEGSAE